MNEIKDVITLLKSRFPLIDKFEAVENRETISSKGTFHHIRALRENLEQEENNDDDQVPQSSNTKYHYWNVFIVRIVEGSSSTSTASLTDLLSEISNKIEVDDHQEQQAEKNLLVLEEGGGLNIREVKVVV